MVKHFAFPDHSTNIKADLVPGGIIILLLLWYWIPDLLVTSGSGIQNPSNVRVAVCIFLHSLGCSVLVVSDCQKFFELKHKKGLIRSGMFKYTRSPNYLGEFLVYSSLGVCAGLWQVYAVYGVAWSVFLLQTIKLKETSNSKKEGWNEYIKTSWVLFPKLVPSSSSLSYSIYAFLLGIIYVGYNLV